ncbi:MAG: nickel-dependent lactate racemase [Deltaproteobacteria bacterium]|nr:nickel-dependent lactate racemase [Deltaproteobacteria bacterium]
MSQIVGLKYGNEKIPFDLPDQTEILHLDEPETRITATQFASGLSQELERLNPGLSDIAIVVGDKTRLCGYRKFLPVLLATLESFGAAPESITIFIAYGTHKRQTDDTCLTAYGDTYRKIRFVHHNCLDNNAFVNLGITSRGTSVLIRRDIVDAGFLITFGAISHHFFAGYGGGRKLIFPGLGHRESIYHNHGLFLDPERQTLSPSCQSGILDGNLLAEDLAEFETFRPADLAVHGILDGGGHVRDLLPGVGTDHFRKACAEYGKNYETTCTDRFDLVIASCGGYPKDINFIQSHKTIDNAAKFVRNGGSLIVLAECPDGVGSKTFLPWFEMGDWKKAFERLAADYEGNGGTALSMMSKLQGIKVFIVTDLSRSDCDTIGIEKMSMDQAKMYVKQFPGSIAAIPSAGMLVKVPL